jgi:hypothetical protein
MNHKPYRGKIITHAMIVITSSAATPQTKAIAARSALALSFSLRLRLIDASLAEFERAFDEASPPLCTLRWCGGINNLFDRLGSFQTIHQTILHKALIPLLSK